MKPMKALQKLISLLLLTLCVSFHSCGYDDEELWNEVNKLQERIEKLEDICTQTNANINSIQTLLDAMKQNYSIASITPLEGDKGYTITFTNNKSIILYNGVDGNDGEDGKDGENGKDGVTPQIGVKDLGNGYYAWTLNGEVLTDNAGNPLHVNGKDGEDGTNGTSGSSAPTPQLKTGVELVNAGVSGNWDKTAVYISVNGGETWTKVSASGTNPLFADVDTSKNDCVVFTLVDGTMISVPRMDRILDLLFGTWLEADLNWKDKLIFNKDFSYQEIHDGQVKNEGTFEFDATKGIILFYANKKLEQVSTVLEISENKLFLIGYRSGGYTEAYYKVPPVTLSQTKLVVPKEGGTFSIDVQTNEEVALEKGTLNPPVSEMGIYNNNIITAMNLSFSLDQNTINIKVGAATGNNMLSEQIDILNKFGNNLVSLVIEQEGINISPEVSFTGLGKQRIIETFQSFTNTLNNSCIQMDLPYTLIKPNDNFRAPLLVTNNGISSVWSNVYRTIRKINVLCNQAEQEQVNGPLYAPLQALSAIIYYQLVTYWGSIPYLPTDYDYSLGAYPSQLSANDIFSVLTTNLISAITALEEKKNDNSTDIEKSILFSKDVSRMALAHIYMYQGKYQEALPLLNNIVKNGFYSLEASKEYTDIHNKEVIFAQITSDNTFVPIYTYTDVILSLAECEMYANNTTKAMEYIQQVADKKGITITESDTKQALKEVYKATLANYGGYFAFLKRNGLAVSELGLSSEDYLLFPIPQQEMQMNPNLVQNPGY